MHPANGGYVTPDYGYPNKYLGMLAAEVLALRDELKLFRDASEAAELRIVQLREELDAVKYSLSVAQDKDYEALVRDFIERPVVDDESRAKEQSEGVAGHARYTASDGAVITPATQKKP